MTLITIEFKRGGYRSLDESFISELKQHIELSDCKPKDLSMVIKEEFNEID